ncbi:alpha-L-rhamnosidase-related protein [Lactiplantibacillus modestisalitolerans]|uniref:Family 78 glycoside hydrolase catalytic domain n=1 Tax=Lactiplantibacillus modestisalitolerans TaxID=1457219 RepID=A0ABV5WS89_9LACO|nr:family 78 glycoside hydrolase catalytic domain [Lactiplantibacillus modestisalitolerans]
MAFTFQINDDVHFKHDQQLLAKANHNRPTLHHQQVKPQTLVKLVKQADQLEGWGVEAVAPASALAEQPLKRDGKLILDFGDHQVGQFSIQIDSVGSPMDAPLSLKLKFAEMPAELARNSADYDGWLSKSWIQEETVHLDTLPATLALPRRYSFRYVELTVIDTSPKWQAVFSEPVVTTVSSANPQAVSVPKLADPELKKIYQVGVKTLADCMQDVFEDGPKRDRRLWIGDLRLQALADYATFKNTALVKRCLYLFGAMPAEDGRVPANVFTKPQATPDDTFLFDYSLFFISILADYQAFQADAEVMQDLYPVAKRQMDVALKQVSVAGELQLTEDNPVFIDWSNDFDKATAGQAVIIYVLKQFIQLAKQQADPDLATYQSQLAALVAFAKTKLFDADQGLFVSGPNREVNVASQVWMTLAHVLSPAERQRVMQTTVHQLFPITGIATPYMYHHVTAALFEAGLTDDAIALMKNYWGKMIRLGADTYWEAFDPNHPDYSPYGSPILNSYCHAWSCTPVYLIDKYLVK